MWSIPECGLSLAALHVLAQLPAVEEQASTDAMPANTTALVEVVHGLS
jgi:hypothetical protein